MASRWPSRRLDPNRHHWPSTRLDLAGAVLTDFDFSNCRVGAADFGEAAFTGDTRFGEATFFSAARFIEAAFSGDAWFVGAVGLGRAKLSGVRLAPVADGRRVWPAAWRVEAGVDGWQTLRLAAAPAQDTTTAEGGPAPQPEAAAAPPPPPPESRPVSPGSFGRPSGRCSGHRRVLRTTATVARSPPLRRRPAAPARPPPSRQPRAVAAARPPGRVSFRGQRRPDFVTAVLDDHLGG
ncbi:pentapeptide repeat-containing protein [Nonomuraea aurantiaca]|uniref:pentapeptide repeat-containing protein n=1 Tax=Nonomuraea aurantiaca TaxID=2878562 RepID=UPI0021E69586|nr:pentapeptide repeat-containing protein [Nonomuraea aurantiaca]